MLPRGRTRSSGAASSTDSLDSILAQFEVVQATGPPPAPAPSPRTPASPAVGILSALLQHSPLQRLQLPGRPPRPEPTATSSPYQPKRRRRRQQGPDEQGYTPQLLLPFASSSPQPSQGLEAGGLPDFRRPPEAAARLAVCLTEDSPAVAAAAVQSSSRWASDGCASPSLESIASLGSNSSSSGGGSSPPQAVTPRWGQQAAADPLFPLNLQLPSPSRPPFPAAAPAEPAAAWPEAAATAAAAAAAAAAQASAAQQPPELATAAAAPAAAAAAAAAATAEQMQPLASPFQAAAAQPAPSDSSSNASEPAEALQEQQQQQRQHQRQQQQQQQQQQQRQRQQPGTAEEPGSPESCSRQSEADTPNSSSDYGSVAGADLGGGSLPREAGKGGGGNRSLPPPLFSGMAGKQPRPQLRKRDFESELLERLLSSSGRGPLMGPAREQLASAGPAPRALWRAFGLPRLALVATVFLCLLLFLAVFSAGRVHAQRFARAESAHPDAARGAEVELLALAQLTTAATAAAAAAEPPRLQAAGDGKHRHSSSGSSGSLDPSHLHLHLDGPSEELRGPEDVKRRGRHAAAGLEAAAAEPQGGRHKPGLRLLLLADTLSSSLARACQPCSASCLRPCSAAA